jgi:hypothetical protein
MSILRALSIVLAAALAACSANDGASSSSTSTAPDNDAGAPGPASNDGGASSDGAAPLGDAASATDSSTDSPSAASCAKYLGGGAPSAWVHADATGKLAYKTLARGDRILDFSFAGYSGGGVAIPDVPARVTLTPSGGDDTQAIANAIAQVSAMPLAGGVRGAVLLAPGTFNVGGSFEIAASGVVLRGSGSGAGGTTINATGASRQVMRIRGSGTPAPVAGSSANITDAYVPSGATTLTLDDASKLAVGDAILIDRPVTAAWVHFMGMDTLVRDDAGQTWLAPGTSETWERRIVAIAGNTITIDIPISDSIDKAYASPATVSKYTFAGRIAQVGIEHVRLVAPVRSATTELSLVRLDSAEDAWVRDVAVHNFTEGVWSGPHVRRLTIEDAAMTHDATTYVTSEAPFDFWLDSTETLIQRSSSTGGDKIWYLATQDLAVGPNVALGFTASGINSHVTAHQRWATGFLVDGANVQGGVTFGDNGSLGTGEGWSMGWGVVWNSKADVLVQAPPGSMSWSIGNIGTPIAGTSLGTYESNGAKVAIPSLYLAQLCERRGEAAVKAIGY